MRLLIFTLAFVAAPFAAQSGCPPPGETILAREARPGGEIYLDDGRTVRLAGVALSDEGRAALGALVRGKALTVRPLGRPDRWGRIAAHVDGVEESLLSRGFGHAAAQAEGACLAPLLNAESRARAARAGVWARPDYVLSAKDEAGLTAALGRDVLAEGKVISARRAQGRVYLNFARYWKTGLSLIIAENDWPLFAGGRAAESLVGARLRVRGRLEYRAGPAVLAGPDDRIEILEP